MGFLLIIGICLVAYFALGVFYWQQGSKQEELEEQIQKTNLVVSKPLPSDQKLKAEFDEVNRFLTPLAVPVVLELIVGIAKVNGIDIDPAAGKFNIPSPRAPENRRIGENNYQVLSVHGVRVRGEPDSVTAFISDLDAGETLKIMVLKKLEVSQAELEIKAEELTRREEYLVSDNGNDG
jgi:hypothetical protein